MKLVPQIKEDFKKHILTQVNRFNGENEVKTKIEQAMDEVTTTTNIVFDDLAKIAEREAKLTDIAEKTKDAREIAVGLN